MMWTARQVLPPSLLLAAVIAAAPAATAVTGDVTLSVPGRSSATPWIAARGAFVAVAWGAAAEGKTDVFVAVSRDAGRTFSTPVRVNRTAGDARLGGELPPRVALADGAGTAPDIVVLWTARDETTTIKLSRSRDGGVTFDAPLLLQRAGAPGDRGWPALATDRTGRAHAIWLDHRGLALAKTDAGAKPATHDLHDAGVADGAVMAQRSGLYYASAEGGVAERERELTAGVCYCCKTALAVAPDGALYAAWRHVYPGNVRDIAMTVSRDGGRSFSAPSRVSEDRWQLNGCPDDGPAMAVDGGGTVHLVWPTVIGGDTPQGAIFYATTQDGLTFTPRVRVPTLGSPKPSHPQIVVGPEGEVTVAWDEVLQGVRVAAVSRLARGPRGKAGGAGNAGSAAFDPPQRLTDAGTSMYPVFAATSDGLLAAWTAGAPAAQTIRVQPLAHILKR